jgi:aldose sugar dehydrogenase
VPGKRCLASEGHEALLASAAGRFPRYHDPMRLLRLVALALAAPALASDEPFFSKSPPEARGVRVVRVASGLEHPWGLVWLPDGTMLVTERSGRLRIVRGGKVDPKPVSGVPAVFASGQGGLLDVALHPRFSENRLVYLSYAHGTRGENRTRVARGVLTGTALREVKVIFEASPAKEGGQHFGSRLGWLPDETLLVSIGDGGNPPSAIDGKLSRLFAQDPTSHLGKVVRLADDGSIPKDNPFAGRKDAAPAVWTLGLRNVQGLAVAPDGTVWVTDHGPRGGDEVNRLSAGANYGWPTVTHGREYSGKVITEETSRPEFVDPLLVWTPSIAPSGLAVYGGDRFPAWRGSLLGGGLVSADVRRLEVDERGRIVAEERIPIGARVRDVRQGPDGFVYVLTDERDGEILRLEPAR